MSKPSLRVGITGGIGSGKTTVCQIFETLGVPVYYADYWAKWLIVNDVALRAAIAAEFGAEAYTPDGEYNRAYIAGLVFAEPARLQALNGLVHPLVERHARTWHEAKAAEGHAYTLKEAALLIESGSYRALDKLIVVTAPAELRVRRVMQRDGVAEAAVRARMESQLPEPEKVALADFIVVNDGVAALVPQVVRIHRALS